MAKAADQSRPRKKPRGRWLPPEQIYQLKVTLRWIKPPVWRRVLVGSHRALGDLHHTIQCVFGWEDCHLHQFDVQGEHYVAGWEDEVGDAIDEDTVCLCELGLKPTRKFRYRYDFGDNWEHEILLEKVLEPQPDVRYPVCLTGRRAGPPEDCGGPWGYADLLETLADPTSSEHEEMLQWLGGPIDPEAFSLDDVNARLHGRRRSSRR